MLIALAIGSIIVAISYTFLNQSSIVLKKNIETLDNNADLSTLTKIITQDIKLSKEEVQNNTANGATYKLNGATYQLRYIKTYGENRLYQLVRNKENSETILLNNVIENGFTINKENNNLYKVNLIYLENNKTKEYTFYVSKNIASSSINTNPPVSQDNTNGFEYKGYFVTVDFAKQPKVYMIESTSYNGILYSNNLEFTFMSKGQNINRNFDLMISSDSINLGYDFNDNIFDTKYNNPQKPFVFNSNTVYGIYIKNINLLNGNSKNEISIDTSNCSYNVIFAVELNGVVYKYKPLTQGNRDKNIKIFYNNGGLHTTNLEKIN